MSKKTRTILQILAGIILVVFALGGILQTFLLLH